MRVLFANSIQMFAGAEVWFLTIARALRERGHDVALVCRPHTELETRAQEAGIPVFGLRFGADIGPLSVYRAARILQRLTPDVVITNQDKELRTFGLASRLTGTARVVHRRAIDHPLKDNLRYRLTYTWLARRVVANSRATRETLLSSAPWLRAEHVAVIYNGIDPQPFLGPPRRKLRDEWGVRDGEKLVGFVGQLDERKGIADLLRAYEILRKKARARLVFVGKGPLGTEIRRRAPQAILAGFRKDIPEVMKSLDVLVLPSYWEGFGIVLIEAMAAGRPVVATNVSSIPEIVVDGDTGLLVPVGKPDALAEALFRVLVDSALAKRLGETGRKRVLEQFTVDRMTDEWERLLREVVGGTEVTRQDV